MIFSTLKTAAKIYHPIEQYHPVEARHSLPKSVFEVDNATYWRDFGGSTLFGWFAFCLLGRVEFNSVYFWLLSIAASVAFYRSLTFIHEISHQQNNKKFSRSFILAWQILVGMPFLWITSHYNCHLAHHNVRQFKTDKDLHYFVLQGDLWEIFKLMVLIPASAPLIFWIRFGILSWLSLLSRRLRSYSIRRLSSMGNLKRSTSFTPKQKLKLYQQEVVLFVYLLAVFWLFVTATIPLRYIGIWYIVSVLTWCLKMWRVIGEHKYDATVDQPLSKPEHILDTHTHKTNWLTLLLFPLGTRYHALHHLHPGIPYHNLPLAHQLLIDNLPEKHFYRATERARYTDAFRQLWQKF